MRDSLIPVQRLLALRQLPGFLDADFDQLAVLAENATEETFSAGTVITRAGRIPAIQHVLEGRITVGETTSGPRGLAGSLEALAGRALAEPMIAVEDTRTLQLGAADFADILEDNYSLLSHVRRGLARRVIAERRRVKSPVSTAGFLAPPRPLGLVDRLLALRHQVPFANGRIHALAAIAEATREVEHTAGATIVRAGEPSTNTYMILEGAVRVGRGRRILGPGEAIGSLEALGETEHADTAEALTPVRLLEGPSTAMLDLIEDHTEIALALIARLAGVLLDLGPSEDDVN